MTLQLVGGPKKIRGITFMGGRETGRKPAYCKDAHDLGQLCAENDIIGYFGGSQFGCMGAFANGIVGHNGTAVGIMPKFLKDVERPAENIKLIWVDDFPQRLEHFRNKKKVDAIVNGAGGIGTDAEHADFGTRDKHDQLDIPNILLNTDGFYDYRILDFRRRAEEGFLWPAPASRLFVANSVSEILPMIHAFYKGEPVQNILTVPLRIAA
jgi:hypothetical protein